MELAIYDSLAHAKRCGFNNSTATKQYDETFIKAWWADLGADRLKGFEFSRVTDFTGGDLTDWEIAVIKTQLRVGEMIWLEG